MKKKKFTKVNDNKFEELYILFMLLMFTFFVLYGFFARPIIQKNESTIWYYYILRTLEVFFGLSIVLNVRLSAMDPGGLKNTEVPK